jgi:hypothetical protein
MLGRAHPGQPVKFETGRQLTRRFENVQRAKEEFWGRWIREVFPELLKQRKWTKDKRDVKVGDIVLRKDETATGQTYKYARVIKVHVGTDGRVRSADIEYRLPGEMRYRTTTRPIHKLVLIIPMEEQTVEKSEEGAVDKKMIQKTETDEPPQAGTSQKQFIKQKRNQGETSSEDQAQKNKTSEKSREANPDNSRRSPNKE